MSPEFHEVGLGIAANEQPLQHIDYADGNNPAENCLLEFRLPLSCSGDREKRSTRFLEGLFRDTELTHRMHGERRHRSFDG